jgi:RNA polymerase sigma-70 factor, ECF subfamily
METAGIALEAELPTLPPTSPSTSPPSIAFQELYQRHSAMVYRTALRITGKQADAEDVMQTVFMRILNLSSPLDLKDISESYMRRAATNASIDILRQRTSRAESPLEGGPDHPAPASNFILKEIVRRAMARLKPDDAELFVLRSLEGLSYDELAEQFGIERGTVASRLHRIRETLLKAIKK